MNLFRFNWNRIYPPLYLKSVFCLFFLSTPKLNTFFLSIRSFFYSVGLIEKLVELRQYMTTLRKYNEHISSDNSSLYTRLSLPIIIIITLHQWHFLSKTDRHIEVLLFLTRLCNSMNHCRPSLD